eukprot:2416936-Amphidinium_carterae.1
MFLDPAGKAYALADSGATNVTLNLKHLGKYKADATPVEMTLASGKVAAYLYKDEVFAEDVKTPLSSTVMSIEKNYAEPGNYH